MNIEMNNTNRPSLLSTSTSQRSETQLTEPSSTAHSLLDSMYDGFHLLLMLKNNYAPENEAEFPNHLTLFLKTFENGAKELGTIIEDIEASKYAFCAALDEIILCSSFSIKDVWERRPLQLSLFGDQLAGENFFNRLEDLRAKGSAHWQAIEIFHMCLLLGFQGKYLIDDSEKLTYLTARLGEEITRMKGKQIGFAPHAERPDHIINKLRSNAPIWIVCSVFALISLSGFLGLNRFLSALTDDAIRPYNESVKLGPRMPNLTITLP
jgi:type VI secretion system protein ImpK